MKELHFLDSDASAEMLRVFNSANPVVLYQLPSVYTLMAPSTQAGADVLNRAKQRLPGKNYGTAIGSVSSFNAMARNETLPVGLSTTEEFEQLTGAFIRMNIGDPDFNSVTVRRGTHQGLLLNSSHRDVFTAIERELHDWAEPALYCGNHYMAPLCTSANRSGDPLGSITDWDRAYKFGVEKNISLAIRSEEAKGNRGSYPIFYLNSNRVSIERSGPGEDEIKRKLPGYLFNC